MDGGGRGRGRGYRDSGGGWGLRERRVGVGERVGGGGREFVNNDSSEEEGREEQFSGGGKGRRKKKSSLRPLESAREPERRIVVVEKIKGEDPLSNLARYVHKARVDLTGFSWAAADEGLNRHRGSRGGGGGLRMESVEEKRDREDEARRKRDEGFEVLIRSRSLPVKLREVRRIKMGGDLRGGVVGGCESFSSGGRIEVSRVQRASADLSSSPPCLFLSSLPPSQLLRHESYRL